MAAENGLELVRKRGSQVLYGVAPQTTESRYCHLQTSQRRRTRSSNQQARSTTSPQPVSPRSITAMLTSPATAAAAAALAMENNRSTAAAASGSEARRDAEAGHRGGAGDRPRSVTSSEGNGGSEREGSSVAAAEFAGWGGAGGAGWGHWSHVDMQLVVGQASKHRVSEGRKPRAATYEL